VALARKLVSASPRRFTAQAALAESATDVGRAFAARLMFMCRLFAGHQCPTCAIWR